MARRAGQGNHPPRLLKLSYSLTVSSLPSWGPHGLWESGRVAEFYTVSVQQERLIPVDQVRVLIIDAADETNVLVDTTTPVCEFSTGSVGYKLNLRDAQFARTE